MARREFYQVVDLGGRTMLVRSRIGGGFSKVADFRTVSGAQRLVDELRGANCVHIDVVREALALLDNDDSHSDNQAAELLRSVVGQPEE